MDKDGCDRYIRSHEPKGKYDGCWTCVHFIECLMNEYGSDCAKEDSFSKEEKNNAEETKK